jgi:hypothetical protein
MTDHNQRGAFLSVVAILFAVLAVSNTTKALQFLMDRSRKSARFALAHGAGISAGSRSSA